jgi:hypothetical protein
MRAWLLCSVISNWTGRRSLPDDLSLGLHSVDGVDLAECMDLDGDLIKRYRI